MIRAIIFMGIVTLWYILALVKGPLYGLYAYAIVYFFPPTPAINWWAEHIPFSRWSLISSVVLIASFLLHRDQLVKREFRSARWLFVFTFLSLMISLTIAVDKQESMDYTYKLITYCITTWFIVRVLATPKELRSFMLTLISLSGVLSIVAFLEGKRIHGRLEHIGSNDAFEANEFALLLGGIIPLMLPFLFHGKKSEKIVCVIFLPLILNAFILCNSRGSTLALVLGLVYGVFVIADKRLRYKMLVAAVCVIPLFVYLTDAEFKDRISSLLTTDEAMQDESAINELSSGRTEIWKYGFRIVNDHPLGAGANSFRYLAHLYMPPEMLKFNPGASYGVRAAHNSYLQVLVEQGYAGLFIWLAMCIHTMLLLWRASRIMAQQGMSNSFVGMTILAMSMAFVCTLLGGMFASRVYYEFFWWQVAMSVVAYSCVRELERDCQKADMKQEVDPAAEGNEFNQLSHG